MAFGYETSSWWAGKGCVQPASKRKKTSTTQEARAAADAKARPSSLPLPPAPPTPADSPETAAAAAVAVSPEFQGLPNLGNTCYLNAVLQVLSHLAPFVDDVLRTVHRAASAGRPFPKVPNCESRASGPRGRGADWPSTLGAPSTYTRMKASTHSPPGVHLPSPPRAAPLRSPGSGLHSPARRSPAPCPIPATSRGARSSSADARNDGVQDGGGARIEAMAPTP